jgi:hypothetical protein
MPGFAQTHDLESHPTGPDIDWMVVESKAERSYEADVRGGNVVYAYDLASCGFCNLVRRVDASGTVLTEGVAVDGKHPFGNTAVHVVVRWIATATQREFIRVGGDTISAYTANDRYEIVLRDTTLAVPRWNNFRDQMTVLLISNQSAGPVKGSIFFYDAGGELLHTEPLDVPLHGLQVLRTEDIGALAGSSGSAAIAHDGGYGALAGKAVSLEPATGFAFDTPMTYVPY